ncbi:MAG TPA: hypothetical protein VKB65_03360 [Myxococcota bacterium]|nr:hypothetical protein [Myxococcota bacterium]
MGFLRRLVGAAVLLVVVAVGLQFVAAESGEVVVLHTFVDGDSQTRRLWIVDDAGVSWLRAGQPRASWYQRILQNPEIEVVRGGETYAYTAFPVEGGPTVDHVNALMSRKYGWADGLIGAMVDRTDAVAIRLDPR